MDSKMEIYDVLKILSCKTKLKLLVHFYSCKCQKVCVNELVDKFGTTQANVSKHLLQMEKQNVLEKHSEHRTVFYKINQEFCLKWKDILQPTLKKPELEKFKCQCS